MLKDLGSMRIYQILKDDSVYDDVFNKRIARLEMYRSELLAGNIKREVNKSINLTKQCRLVADDLKNGYIRLAKIFPAETEQAIDQLIVFQMKAATQANGYKFKIPKQMIENALASQKEDYAIAKQVMLESKKTGKTVQSILDDKFPNDGSFKHESLQITTAMLTNNYEAYMTAVSFGSTLIELSEIFRGLFYMGIVDYHGSELDEKNLQKHLQEFAKEAAGVFAPSVMSAVSLMTMINQIVNVIMDLHNAEVPEIIKEAQKLELFLRKYQASLKVWKSTAKFTITRLDSLGKAIKQYQVTDSIKAH